MILFWKDKRGSSLILVMITMTFLILLAGAVITTTITNIRLKSSQKKTQENFYSTDSALDEISAGIRNLSSEASATAYESALSLYNASKTLSGSTMNDKYTTDFLDTMLKKLTPSHTGINGTETNYKYSDDVLISFLTDEEKDANVYVANPGGQGDMVLEGDSLLLKNVQVKKTMKVDNDYMTTLRTDIRIMVPPVQTKARSEYLTYALLADNQIVMSKALGNNRTYINGNIYSGTVRRDSTEESKKGIVINGSTVHVNAEYIITRGDISVNKGKAVLAAGSVADEAKIWAENARTEGKNAILQLKGSSYISDDLELNGENNQVTLEGRYYGYNFTDNYSAYETTGQTGKKAPYSSTISINGKNDRLLMSGLSELVLAGRTFISKKVGEQQNAASEVLASANPDLEFGESLTVKSSQLAYLVGMVNGSETSGFVFIAKDQPDDGSFLTGYNHYERSNGETALAYYFEENEVQYIFDYQAYVKNMGFPDNENPLGIGLNMPNPAQRNLMNSTWKYIDNGWLNTTHPLRSYYRNDKSANAEVTYFYLNFEDSDAGRNASSKFYDAFFKKSTLNNSYKDINGSYLDGYAIRLNSNADYILSAGNILTTNPNGDLQLTIGNDDIFPTNAFLDFAKVSNREYMSRQMSLVDDYEGAKVSRWRLYDVDDVNNDGTLNKSGKSDKTNLFDVLVDRSKLPQGSAMLCGTYPVTRTTASGATENVDCSYLISGEGNSTVEWPEDYTTRGYTRSGTDFYGIIVAAGDVVISDSNFHGLIIAGGDISFSNSDCDVYADEEVVTNAIEADKKSSKAFYDVLSKYFRKSVDATIGSGTGEKDDTDIVTFENWKKNPEEEPATAAPAASTAP